MRNPLYHLLKNSLKQHAGTLQLELGDQRYSVLSKRGGLNNTAYYLIKLPTYPELHIRGREYQVKEGHATIFEHKSHDEGYFSAYHVTLRLGPVLIRVYFNENDTLAMEPKAWLYDEKKSQTITPPLTDFFQNDKDSHLISLCIINLISPLIAKLRKEEKEKRSKLENKYSELLNKLERNTLDTPKKCKQYVNDITACIKKLEKLKDFSLDPLSLNGIIKIHKSQLDFVKNRLESLQHPPEHDLSPTHEPLSSQETSSAKEEETEEMSPPPNTALNQWIGKINLLNNKPTLDLQSAEELKTSLVELEKTFFDSRFIREKEQFDCLGVLLSSRNKLSAFCLDCLKKGEAESAEPFYTYLTEIPLSFIENCIETDNAKTIETLITKGKISSNTVLSDGTTMYEKAFRDERVETSLFFNNLGTPVGVVFMKVLFESLSKGELDLSLIAKSIRLNATLLPKIPVFLWPSICDNSIKQLQEFRRSLLHQNTSLLHSKSNRKSKNNKSKLKKDNEINDHRIQLIDFVIEAIKLCGSISKFSPYELQILLEEGVEKQKGLMNLMLLLGIVPENLGTIKIPETIMAMFRRLE